MKYTKLSLLAHGGAQPIGGWRPLALRNRFLMLFALLCVFAALLVQFVIRICTDDGCPVFGDATLSQISSEMYFVYNLIPTILTLGMCLLWALIQHDVLRLEPYFRMSYTGGATAAESIFLDYPYRSIVGVLLGALKERHYVVLMATSVLVVMSIVVTPLASGLFDDSVLLRQSSDTAMRSVIHHRDHLLTNLSPRFSYMAYDYAWLNRSLPPFMTPEYAVLPVKPPTGMILKNETWTAETTLFEADFSCKSAGAEVVWNPEVNNHAVLLTAPNLGYSHRHYRFGKFLTEWTGIADSVYTSDNVSASGTYITVWASGRSAEDVMIPRNMTARQCTASYHMQTVNATFMMPQGVIMNVERIGTRKMFEIPPKFVATIEGYNTALTIPKAYEDDSGRVVGLGYLPPLLANVDSQLRRRLGKCPEEQEVDRSLEISNGEFPSYSAVYLDNILGLQAFALYGQRNDTLAQLLDPETLDKVYRDALKLLFAVAVNVEMVNPEMEEVIQIRRAVPVKGFRADIQPARVVQGTLAAVITLVIAIALLNERRGCNLDGEPNSLAAALRILSRSLDLAIDLRGAEYQRLTDLRRRLDDGRRYKLELEEGWGPKILVYNANEDRSKSPHPGNKPWVERLWILQTVSGVILITSFVIVIVLLVVAYGYSQCETALSTFWSINSFGYKFLYSYAPIALTTAVELTLVGLGCYFCMLGPYKALKLGMARSSKSLCIDFDKSPPHFQLYRSIQHGNFPLAALTTAILLTNVLAVGFSGLFSSTMIDMPIETQGHTPATAKFHGSFNEPALEVFYIATGNMSRDIPAPQWTTAQYYILPFFPVVEDKLQYYEGSTLGIGADVRCSLMHSNTIAVTCRDPISNRTTTICPSEAHPEKNMLDISVNDRCWKATQQDTMDYIRRLQVPNGWYSPTGEYFSRNDDCPNIFWAIWVERPANPSPDPNNNKTLYKDTFEAVGLKCAVKEKVVELKATVNNIQQVLSVTETRQLDADEIANMYSANMSATARLLPTFTETISTGIYKAASHTHRMMWMDYLIVTLDPSISRHGTNLSHLPNTTNLARAFEDVFIRLFAINTQLYADDLLSVVDTRITTTMAVVQMYRVRMNPTMFSIVLGILVYIMIVLVVLYWWEQPRIPGHIPQSLAGMYTLLYASNAKDTCSQVVGKDPEERAKNLSQLGRRYSCGLFTVEDGTKHFGVYEVEEEIVEEVEKNQRTGMQ